MIIDLKELKKKGIQNLSFMFLYDAEECLTDIPNVKVENPIKINGNITVLGKTVIVEAEVAYTLKGACTRCAADAEMNLVTCINEEFFSEGNEGYTYKNDKLNLTKAVNDAVILSMPSQVLCKDDCKGICFNCGVNLNEGECKCQKS